MNASADREDRARAVLDAATAAQWWANAVRAQQQATPSHTDFYALAAHLVATLYALDDLAVLLSSQVGRYGQDRPLYDDTRTVDPADRLADAVDCLHRVHDALETTAVAANEFWSAIGHIGVEVAP